MACHVLEGRNWTPFEDLDPEPDCWIPGSSMPLHEWYRETPLPLARPLVLRGEGSGSGSSTSPGSPGSSGSSRSESSWGLDEFREL